MKIAVGLSVFSLMSSVVFAGPKYRTVCSESGLDHGYKAVFTYDVQNPGSMNVSLSSQSIRGPQKLADLPCTVSSNRSKPSVDQYTTWNCTDGNDAGYRVTLTSGGFAGRIHSGVFKYVTQVAQLPCVVQATH